MYVGGCVSVWCIHVAGGCVCQGREGWGAVTCLEKEEEEEEEEGSVRGEVGGGRSGDSDAEGEIVG